MTINNNAYGGFIMSKNIMSGIPIRYSFREESNIPQLNGWNFFSEEDDESYVSYSNNFQILSAETVYNISLVILELFDAPYGTDLCWLYKEGVHVGFYDLVNNRETTLSEILENPQTY